MAKPDIDVQIMIYYDKYVGVPQLGLFLTDKANEANQAFVANAEIEDVLPVLDITAERPYVGYVEFMGRIPRMMSN